MLRKPPSPPSPDIPALEPNIRGATTIREQLDKHHNLAACESCIDPPDILVVRKAGEHLYRLHDGISTAL